MNLSEGNLQPILIHLIDTANFPKDKSCLSLGEQQIGGKEKGDGSQSSQKHVSQKAQITPASRPSEKIHGGGWAGCGWCCLAASNLGPADPSAPRHRRALQR